MNMHRKCAGELGRLADPNYYRHAPDIDGIAVERLDRYLRSMLLIRKVEEQVGEMVTAGLVRCPCHLSIGQEAIAVGVSEHLRPSDRVFGGHRSHAHYLALGGSIEELFAEVMGKKTGCSKGMGGSMHLYQAKKGFLGSVPIVGATIPVAVGAALAAKMDGLQDIAVSYFGDGAAEEGVLHESLNLASHLELPILFVCENNLFASHLDINFRQASDIIARLGKAHRVEFHLVDGNDVVGVARAAEALIEVCRSERRPVFLEAITYRWRGHVGPREDVDVGVRRSREDIIAWKQRDPIRRLKEAMTDKGLLAESDWRAMERDIDQEIRESTEAAKAAPYPGTRALCDLVYA